jgi:hypothetical protein
MMTYQEFRKANPATREFHRHTSEQRSNLAASHRLTPRQRSAVGEFFYTHPMLPGVGFPTAKIATTRAYALYQASEQIAAAAPRIRIAVDVSDDTRAVEEAAEDETMHAECMGERSTP